MGFKMQICSILHFSRSILVKCCVHLQIKQAPAKLKCFFQSRIPVYSRHIDCFVVDSSRLHLTFVAFCILSVICKQQLQQHNYSVDQSALSTGFQTDFMSSQYGISVAESQMVLLMQRGVRRNSCFRMLGDELFHLTDQLLLSTDKS